MVGGEEVVLVLPQQYMNRSGQAAVGVVRFFKVAPEEIVVVHDELDFDPGVVRVRLGGSAGGHNGVSNLIEHLGTPNFPRVRIGIGHPRRAQVQQETAQWVLSQPRQEERPVLEQATEDGCQAVRWIVERGVLAAQQEFNTRAGRGEG